MKTILEWKTPKEDMELILKVSDRALHDLKHYPDDKLMLTMDIEACHQNGCKLDLAGLLIAPGGDFSHDIYGIRQHLNRRTGKLENCFVPRYAAKP